MKRNLATAVALVFAMFMANAVCAGVMRVLVDIVGGLGMKNEVLALIICGVISVGAALLFLDGGIRWGVKLLKSI